MYLMRLRNFKPQMKPSELPGARRLYRLTNGALAQIREPLAICRPKISFPPDSLLKAQVEASRILRIDVPLSAKRQFQLFCSEHFPGLADILDCLAADQLWALLSMHAQLADSDQPQAQSAAVRFDGLGRRYVLVVFDDRPEGLLSHADGSASARGSPKAHRPFLGRDPPRLDAGHRLQFGKELRSSGHKSHSTPPVHKVGFRKQWMTRDYNLSENAYGIVATIKFLLFGAVPRTSPCHSLFVVLGPNARDPLSS